MPLWGEELFGLTMICDLQMKVSWTEKVGELENLCDAIHSWVTECQ